MKKQVLAIILSLCMAAALPPTQAFAANNISYTVSAPTYGVDRVSFTMENIILSTSAIWLNAVFYVAAYGENNSLFGLESQDLNIKRDAPPTTLPFSFEMKDVQDARYLKLFIWNKNKKTSPVGEAKVLPGVGGKSIATLVSDSLAATLPDEDVTYGTQGNKTTVTAAESDRNVYGVANLLLLENRANLLCVDENGNSLDDALLTTPFHEIFEARSYTKFIITNKTDAADSYEIVVGQSDVVIVGLPPIGIAGTAYSYQLTGANSYSTADALPAGLSLSQSGLISGTPTAENGENCRINVTGSKGGKTGIRTLRLQILPGVTIAEQLTSSYDCRVLSLSVPEGAIEDIEDSNIQIRSTVPPSTGGIKNIVSCYDISVEQNGTEISRFNTPLEMKLKFNPSRFEENERPIVAYYDADGWHREESEIDMVAGTATVYTSHFSIWSLFGSGKGEYIERNMGLITLRVNWNKDQSVAIGKRQIWQRDLAVWICNHYAIIASAFDSYFKTADGREGRLSKNMTINIMDSGAVEDEGYANDTDEIYISGSFYNDYPHVARLIIHELFHTVQMSYVNTWFMAKNLWFTESTADCVSVAIAETMSFGLVDSPGINLGGRPLELSWFNDITAKGHGNEYAGTYFIAHLANARPTYENRNGKIWARGLSPAVPSWVANFYADISDEYSTFGNFMELLRTKTYNGTDKLLDFAHECLFYIGTTRSPLLDVSTIPSMSTSGVDSSGNYIPSTIPMSISGPGVAIVHVPSFTALEGGNAPSLHISTYNSNPTASSSMIAYRYERTGENAVTGVTSPPPGTGNTKYSYLLLRPGAGDNYAYLVAYVPTTWAVTLGNLGGCTENNVNVDYTASLINAGPDEIKRYSVTVTAQLQINGTNIGQPTTQSFQVQEGGTVSGTISAHGTLYDTGIGWANKKYSFTINGAR